jgi:hypothetical protein
MLDVVTETVANAPPKMNGITLWVNGTLAVNADATNHLTMPATQSLTPTGAVATLKGAPTGSSVVAVVKVNTVAWLTFTFAAGVTSVVLSPATVLAAGPVPASGVVSLAITNVGSSSAGTDLSISIYV